MLSGEPAFRFLLVQIETEIGNSAEVAPEDFADLCLFRWLAQCDCTARVNAAIEALQVSQPPAEKKAKKYAASSSAAGASSTAVGSVAADRAGRVKASAMALFFE